ncbi:MAG: FumA C-terminus/TtdB family hydratase beta subunit [Syntrophomonadaceae bacterium]|jgi:tartrate/fumarate subfamily iron-sulfur-dependent hydro-lyase beta chain
MKTVKLETPISTDAVRSLEVGDMVYLHGIIYSARDFAHAKMKETIAEVGELPFELKGGVIFHAGPVVAKKPDGWNIEVFGPTTSLRLEGYARFVAELGVKLIIGKGGMGEESRKAFVENGMAYLQAAPGCGVKMAQNIKKVSNVFWPELGLAEAVWALQVEEMGPFIVGMDASGRSVYTELAEKAMSLIDEWYK